MFKWLLGNRSPVEIKLPEAPPEPTYAEVEHAKAMLMNLGPQWIRLIQRLRPYGATVFVYDPNGSLVPSPMMLNFTGPLTDWEGPIETLVKAGIITVQEKETNL